VPETGFKTGEHYKHLAVEGKAAREGEGRVDRRDDGGGVALVLQGLFGYKFRTIQEQ
jgi:hypothetical protein